MALNALVALFAVAASGGATIAVEDVAPHVRELSSAKYEGRLTLAKGGTLAAEYLAEQMRAIGLRPGGDDGTFFHSFPVTFGFKAGEDNSLRIVAPDGRAVEAKLDQDFRPLVNSASGATVQGELVFLGYGLNDEAYDDYRGADLRGKVAVVLRGSPAGYRPVSNAEKAAIARAAGANGLLVVGKARPSDPELPAYTRGQGIGQLEGFVAAAVTSAWLKEATGFDADQARTAAHPEPRPLNASVTLRTQLVQNTGIGRNVVGFLPGTDPNLKNELVIVGAHYDHIGRGEVGSTSGSSEIHYGADDNASGTAGVLGLAKYFARKGDNRRTIVFQLYQGEELGLLGSQAWARQFPDKLQRTTAMINLDMIGLLRDGHLNVYGTSTSEGWAEVLRKVAVPGIKPKLNPQTRADSDHFSFASRNVPVLFLFTGIHPQYHNEGDVYDLINTQGLAQVASFAAQLVEALDARPTKLAFNPQSAVGNRAGDRQGAPRDSARRVRIGFIPDMTGQANGVVLMGASPGSPAERAGFKAGDVILEFGGRKIASLEDLQEAMTALKPGDKVKVRYRRGDKELEAEIQTEQRS
ncbi:MAG: M28 family peptidase [Fimbriimonadales bacterium]|nr:M28 family peptidase [Fimbriimonadales bacterium]